MAESMPQPASASQPAPPLQPASRTPLESISQSTSISQPVPVLQAVSVSLELGGRTVVNQVSARIDAGQWISIIGPNGAGKSSLLGLLAGLHRATAGEIRLHDRPLQQWSTAARAREIGWLAQQGEADGDIAARDVVRLGRLPHHGLFTLPGARDEAAVDAAMSEAECHTLGARRLNELSGGERQRVLLARVLAGNAPAMLLDEPTTHLDAPHQRALLRTVRKRARAGVAAAVVLHDLTLALAADRVWVMDRGRLVADGRPDDPVLHAAMVAVFERAIVIERIERQGESIYMALPVF